MKFFIVAAAIVALACAQLDVKKLFDEADTNDDGMIDLQEELKANRAADINGDGVVNASEFVIAFKKRDLKTSTREALFFFFTSDMNSDQVIDDSEVTMGIRMLDSNNDTKMSYEEYSKGFSLMMSSLKMVMEGAKKVQAMVDAADVDDDDMLTGDEMFSIISPADTDGSNGIDKKEFVTFWMSKTGDNMDRSERLFNKFDGNKDGSLMSDEEKKGIYTAFDYNKDGIVSTEEFMNAMLFMHVQIRRESRMALSVMVTPMFDIQAAFSKADNNSDGVIDNTEFNMLYMSFDANDDGNVTIGEFVPRFIKTGFTEKGSIYVFFRMDKSGDNILTMNEIDTAFGDFDMNKDNSISMDEFSKVMNMLLDQLSIAAKLGAKLSAMVDDADTDGNGMTEAEMLSILAPADMNADGIDKDEFRAFWMNKTGDNMDRSDRLFAIFDKDQNGILKTDDAEAKGFFIGFDYNKDGMVSKDEFLNAMLYLFAEVMDGVEADMMKMKPMMFSISANFNMIDNNTDGQISRDEMHAVFQSFDDDMDGSVNASEFVKHYMMTGMSSSGSLFIFFRTDDNGDLKVVKSEVDSTFDNFDQDDNDMISMAEYGMVMNKTMGELATAKMTGKNLDKIFQAADADADMSLTRTEAGMLLAPADEDKDGLLSKAEFEKYWPKASGEPLDRTAMFFGYLDKDDDGEFGNDNEKTDFFDSFDYNDDDSVTQEEFNNSMLYIYAKILKDLESRVIGDTIIGYFF